MRFFLGTHQPDWLARVDVPLFVSHRRLAPRRRLPRPLTGWALDSGGFTELAMHGRWITAPDAYAEAIARYRDEMPGLAWAAPQDWMCEPFMVEKTGLSVREHQDRTIASVLYLRSLALPVIPVLQGYAPAEYFSHVQQYAAAGISLRAEPVVGLGSVCRRQGTAAITDLILSLAGLGIRLHGFGLKLRALPAVWPHIVSADSMAWSFQARRSPPLAGCSHKSCANCLRYALRWREAVLRRTEFYQPLLWEVA